MQIHELNNYSGDLDSNAYLAVDDGSDTGKVSVTGLLADTNAEITQLDTDLNGRIDNIIAGGTAPSASEIVDARRGADGVDYASLGTAIREQVTDLKSALNEESFAGVNSVNMIRDDYKVNGEVCHWASGTMVEVADFVCYHFMPCAPNTRLIGSILRNSQIVFHDSKKNYISGYICKDFTNVDAKAYAKDFNITTPANCYYISLSYNTTINTADSYYLGVAEGFVNDKDDPIKTVGYADVPRLFLEDISNLVGYTKVSNPNLFDKNRILEGYYPYYGSGNLSANANMGASLIAVEGNTSYAINGFNGCHFAWFASDGTYLSGFTTNTPAEEQVITSPASASALAVSIYLSDRNKGAYICKGTSGSYSEYGSGCKYETSNAHRILYVGEDCEFTTIQSAIDHAIDGTIIIVTQGTYNESLNWTSYDDITIIGTNRDMCIVSYSGQDYNHPPINIGRGSLKNLTFIATTDGESTGHTAYCLHCDNAYSIGTAEKPASLYVENCKFINNIAGRPPIGIGLKRYFTAEFVNCEFYNSSSSAFYCHTWEVSEGVTNLVKQNLIIKNCTLHNNSASDNVIELQSQEWSNTDATVLFQHNVVVNQADSSKQIGMHIYRDNGGARDKYLTSSDWTLSPFSYGNNCALMNA